jgi:hypothetical protein
MKNNILLLLAALIFVSISCRETETDDIDTPEPELPEYRLTESFHNDDGVQNKVSYHYDNNQLISTTIYKLDGEEWVESRKNDYTYVGNKVTAFIYEVEEGSESLNQEIEYTYNDGKIIERVYSFELDNVMVDYNRYTFTYNDQDNLSSLDISVMGMYENQFTLYQRADFVYNKEILEEIIFSENLGEDGLLEYGKITYESTGDKITKITDYNKVFEGYEALTIRELLYTGINVSLISSEFWSEYVEEWVQRDDVIFEYDEYGNLIKETNGDDSSEYTYEEGKANYDFLFLEENDLFYEYPSPKNIESNDNLNQIIENITKANLSLK